VLGKKSWPRSLDSLLKLSVLEFLFWIVRYEIQSWFQYLLNINFKYNISIHYFVNNMFIRHNLHPILSSTILYIGYFNKTQYKNFNDSIYRLWWHTIKCICLHQIDYQRLFIKCINGFNKRCIEKRYYTNNKDEKQPHFWSPQNIALTI
jgi:hypothetical protein